MEANQAIMQQLLSTLVNIEINQRASIVQTAPQDEIIPRKYQMKSGYGKAWVINPDLMTI